MADHDWKQLLDDPEIEGVIERVRLGPGLRHHTVGPDEADDLESWLWDKAVEIAMKYDVRLARPERDPRREWQGWLYTALKNAILRGELYAALHGRQGTYRRAHHDDETTRSWSLEHSLDVWGDHLVAHNAIGNHHTGPSDPLNILVRIETYQYALIKLQRDGIHRTDTPGICIEPLCTKPTDAHGRCTQHYLRWRAAWAVGQCSVDGCTAGVRAIGLCASHYAKARRTETPTCTECDRKARTRGLCDVHAEKTPPPPKVTHCTVDGCDRPHKGRGMCDIHLRRDNRAKARDSA